MDQSKKELKSIIKSLLNTKSQEDLNKIIDKICNIKNINKDVCYACQKINKGKDVLSNKIDDINDIEIYDILAFKVNDVTYVHRVVDIIFDNGDIYFTLKGDANPTSLLIETKVKEEQIIGIYNGNNSLFMGIAITYLQSEIGLIALFMSIAFLINVEVQEYLIDNTYEKRKKILNSSNLISNNDNIRGEINNDN